MRSLALWLLSGLAAGIAQADCLDLPGARMRALDDRVSVDARRAVSEAQQRLKALDPAAPADSQQLAALYAVEAHAYGMLELGDAAREAATQGLALAPQEDDPVRLNLLTAYWENVYDQPGISQAITALAAVRALQPHGSIADTCLLISQGILQRRQGRLDLAIASLTQAYSATRSASLARPRILAAAALSAVMRDLGDYTQALALNQEALDWDLAHDATLELSVNRYLRGRILLSTGDVPAAIEQISQARQLSVTLDDRQGVAFADLDLCRAYIELGQLPVARKQCELAQPVFQDAKSADAVKDVQTLLAGIDLAEGHAERALATLNDVLDHGGNDMPAEHIAQIYELRARTNAALHDFRRAYADLSEYMRRYVGQTDAERMRQISALRAQFETDHEIERNESLRRELALSLERSQRQTQELRLSAVTSVAAIVIIALLTYILITSARYRRELLRLAGQDELTALPNRRRTAALASEALDDANASGKPLTVALLDFDHFKTINDRCGHAAGDHVLKEFARIGRACLREGDTLGRWGGEEFLLVLPDCPLDTAVASIDRLRALALEIQLPASGHGMRVSLSAGLASNAGGGVSLDAIIASADIALYDAKNEGRDLVRIAPDSYRAASSGIRRALRQELTAAGR